MSKSRDCNTKLLTRNHSILKSYDNGNIFAFPLRHEPVKRVVI